MRSLQSAADGRRYLPRQIASGILHDIPPDMAEPRYAEAMAALSRVNQLWNGGLGAPDWDWSRGYPPGWPTSVMDRVKAGIFYRAR